jgi:hypothetical protein
MFFLIIQRFQMFWVNVRSFQFDLLIFYFIINLFLDRLVFPFNRLSPRSSSFPGFFYLHHHHVGDLLGSWLPLTVGRLFNQRDFPAFLNEIRKVLIRNDTYCRVTFRWYKSLLSRTQLDFSVCCGFLFQTWKVPAALEIWASFEVVGATLWM